MVQFLLGFLLLGLFELVHSDAPDYIEFDGLFEKIHVAFRVAAFTGWPNCGRVSGILWAPAMIVEGVIGSRRGVEEPRRFVAKMIIYL